MKTLQEIFDQVSKHLLTQNRQAMMGSCCVYLTDSGLSCAVGCLIPAELYRKDLEGILVGGLSGNLDGNEKRFAETLHEAGVDVTDPNIRSMLNALQRVHDQSAPTEWHTDLLDVARRFKLEFKA